MTTIIPKDFKHRERVACEEVNEAEGRGDDE
jgi:hypothetical protein